MDPDTFKTGMVPPDSPAADSLPTLADVEAAELADLTLRRDVGQLTPAEERRYQELSSARSCS